MPDTPIPHSAVTLLLVDDDAQARFSMAEYLESQGYQVEQVADGQAAWEVFERQPPSLIITDLSMPRMDGLALLQKIEASADPVPVIVVSGACCVQDVVEALRHGAADFLIKPIVDYRVLQQAINKCLHRAQLVEQNRLYREQLERANSALEKHLHDLERDQQAGRQLQKKLFPQQDLQADSYLFSHCVVPSLYLTGDFLEYVRFNDDTLGFYIADVSGHGVSSAFVTALLRHLSLQISRQVRNAILRGDPLPFPTPADAMAYYNSELLTAGIDKHVTMFMGILEQKTNTLIYSVAGHLPMPILATDEGVRYLEGEGMPIGILEEAQYRNFTVRLPERFTLVLCSDGVLEILSEKELIKKEAQLLALVAASDRTQHGIEQQLHLDTISDAPDDIAIMTLVKSA
ncbi:MAG: fused response regulator/phosphatase [Pseudomonadales bacterium]|nr:fused response regulator/phosphatase [Pseudomonadales bacterium]